MITGIGCAPFTLDAKTKAIEYAISLATSTDKNSKICIDLVLAAGIYSFITERVNLPDLPKDLVEEACEPLIESLKKSLDKINKKLEKEAEAG